MNVVASESRILSLCAGVGMLDEGVRLALPGSRVVGYVERDAYAAAVLMARMEDEALEPAPVWCGNLEDFPTAGWAGAVDGITAGFPCPPVSVAGKRAGTEDERWILPAIMRLVRAVEPRWLFLENVGGLRSANAGREFGEVLRLLAESWFDSEWLTLRASDVGAPHERERVFFLAYAKGERRREAGRHCGRSEERVGESGENMADTSNPNGRRGECGEEAGTRQDGSGRRGLASGGGNVAEPKGSGLEGRAGPSGTVESRLGQDRGEVVHSESGGRNKAIGGEAEGLGPFPPSPGDFDAWGRIVEDGSADFRAPAIKPGLRLLADGVALVVDESRADQLRCAGNGVVPLQAACAFTILNRRMNR